MRQLLNGLLICCAVVGVRANAKAAEPLDVIKKSIAASGGKANLLKYKAVVMEGKGTVKVMGMELNYEGKWQMQYPGKYNVRIDSSVMGNDFSILQILDGTKGWMKVTGMAVMELPETQLKVLKTEMQIQEAGVLVPLLDKKQYTLSSLGDSKVKGKPAIGINITSKAGLDANFYFDPKTHMLIKQEYQSVDETGKEVSQSNFLSGYKKFNGVVMPTKVLIEQDGKKFVTAAFSKIEPREKLDAGLFKKPK